MRVLIFALLSLVSFAESHKNKPNFGMQEQNQRLKETNLALRKALRSVTVEQGINFKRSFECFSIDDSSCSFVSFSILSMLCVNRKNCPS